MKKLLMLLAIITIFVSCDVAKKIIDKNLPQEEDQTEDVLAE